MARTDIGRAVPLLKGEYSPTTTYELNDIVSLNGSFYWHYSHEQTTNVAPQATSTWKVVINLADAEAYIARAEFAAESAEDAAEIATAAKTAAESASTTATGASATATAAKNDALTAKTAAETAQAGAVTAKTAAETARDAAQASATAAGTSATNAGNSAGTAEYYAGIATTAGETANEKATEATGAATTATSAAATATSAKDTAVSSASTASTAATTATSAATAAQAVKDSIPQDYTSLSEDVDDLKTHLSDFENWAGYPQNLFNAQFITTNTSNWQIDQNGNDITFTHKTQWDTGLPRTNALAIDAGIYNFSANYNGSANGLALYNFDNSTPTFIRALSETDVLTFEEGHAYCLYLAVVPTQGESVTISDIIITGSSSSGKIQEIENDIDQLAEMTSQHGSAIVDLQDGFNDIADLDVNSLVGIETQNVSINASGTVYTAGSPNYRLVKYDVTAGKKYWITANSNWGNLLWCFYDASDTVVALGQASARESADTIITNTEVTAPVGASYILVAYNSTVARVDCKTQTGYVLKGKWEGKKWVCVGDSLTAENTRTTKHYFDYVAEETGITTVNMGDSGSGYAREQDVGTAFYQRISDCPTDADVVTIFGSFNDLGAGLTIGSVDDTGTTTLAGCINTTIDNLQAVIPLVNLGIIAPTPWDTTQPSTSGQAFNYVEMLKSICERRSIPFLDLWRCSNLRPWDADFRELAYSKDGGSGTHPDENGHKLIAPRFKAFLETLLM